MEVGLDGVDLHLEDTAWVQHQLPARPVRLPQRMHQEVGARNVLPLRKVIPAEEGQVSARAQG